MIPPHERPWLDERTDRIVGRPCWCGPEAITFERAVNDAGESYVFPHRWHRDDDAMPQRVANAIAGQPPA